MSRSMPPASAHLAEMPVPAPPPTIGLPAATWARSRLRISSRAKRLMRRISWEAQGFIVAEVRSARKIWSRCSDHAKIPRVTSGLLRGCDMAGVLTKPMTAEEFFDWVHLPKNRDRHFELEKGEVVQVSRPGEKH